MDDHPQLAPDASLPRPVASLSLLSPHNGITPTARPSAPPPPNLTPAAGYLPLPTIIDGCNSDTGLSHSLVWTFTGTSEYRMTAHNNRLLWRCLCAS